MNVIEVQIPTIRLTAVSCFFDRPEVAMQEISIGPGIPLGIEQVYNPAIGIGGAYAAWGEPYDNARLPELAEESLGRPLADGEKLRLEELGFVCRHHPPALSDEEHLELEVEVGARLLRAAAEANGWDISQVEGVLIGMSVPAAIDFTERIARLAGVPESASKVNIHKACDGSVAGLNLALNYEVPSNQTLPINLAEQLQGKKVLIGGIEGLGRIVRKARDAQAVQLFGTAAGVIGVIPGQTMKFLVGGVDEVYDEEGLLQVHMQYPHSGERVDGSLVEASMTGSNCVRVAGMQHEPAEGAGPVIMSKMGLVKLFVRNGVPPVLKVHKAYQELMAQQGTPEKGIAVAFAHHANLKINQLKAKTLWAEGLCMPIPWLLSEFGNVSAASNMIAFLRGLPNLKPGDHVLFDGFGAGTYYDVLVVEMGIQEGSYWIQ